MENPGFRVGGVDQLGRLGPPTWAFSLKMYVKSKEVGPVGGGRAPGMPIRSANDNIICMKIITNYLLQQQQLQQR